MSSRTVDRTIARLVAELGSAVHAERLRRGWSLADLSDRADVSRSMCQVVESGRGGSIETYARLAAALGLRPEFLLVDPRRRASLAAPRAEDPLHSAMGEAEARHLRGRGYTVSLDEPFQHYQFAGRGDVVAWSIDDRALLHIENRTRFPNVQDALGSFNAKRAYLGEELAHRVGLRRGWRIEDHVIVAIWSAEVLHVLRLRAATFASTCPHGTEPFARWWEGEPGHWQAGAASGLVVFDPVPGGRLTRRRFAGLEEAIAGRPRYRGYADASRAVTAAEGEGDGDGD